MKIRSMAIPIRAVYFLAAVALLGCGDDDAPLTPVDSGVPDTGTDLGVADAGDRDSGLPAICSLTGTASGFGLQHVLGEAYWYSRYNLGSLTMMSGDGDPMMPPPGAPMMMLTMASDTLSTAAMPGNPALLTRVFRYGTPALANADDGDSMNFMNGRWTPIPVSDQAQTTAAAWGWTLLKILEWDKQFHVDAHFGVPGANDIPGAQERFAGLALFAEGLMMSMDFMNTPANYDMSDLSGRYVALAAMSDMAMVMTMPALPHSASNRYRDLALALAPAIGVDLDMMMADMMTGMGTLFDTLTPATGAHDTAIAVQSLVWFSTVAPAAMQPMVRAKIVANADVLIAATPATAADLGFQIRGAVEAWRITDDARYLDAAERAYQSLEAAYDCAHGGFSNQSTYTPEDVAGIVGGLNAALNFVADERPSVQRARASAVLVGFWEAAVDIGGLQISAPLVTSIAAYERLPDDMFHRYPSMPVPPMAGGAHGIAPTFARSVVFDSATGLWTADTSRFDTAGGMHLANEALWLHLDEVSGFPGAP